MSRTVHAVHAKRRPLNQAHWRVLAALQQYMKTGARAHYGDIAEELGFKPASVRYFCMELVEAGRIERLGNALYRLPPPETKRVSAPIASGSSFIRPLSVAQLMGRRA